MQIVFLASAVPDLRWFKTYYMRVFPEGRRNADQQYHALLKLLKSTPMVGEAVADFPDAREYPIRRTPFTVIYRVRPDQIQILRVLDQRSSYANDRRK